MQTLVDNDHKAISPFDEHPGFIQFPVMTLPLYKQWQTWLDNNDNEGFGIARFLDNGSDQPGLARFSFSSIDMLFAFADDIQVGELDNTNGDSWPLEVLVWAGDAAEEWLNSQVSFVGISVEVWLYLKAEKAKKSRSVPWTIALWNRCQRFGVLPHGGGILDQDDLLMAQLEQAQFARHLFEPTAKELIKMPQAVKEFRAMLMERVYD